MLMFALPVFLLLLFSALAFLASIFTMLVVGIGMVIRDAMGLLQGMFEKGTYFKERPTKQLLPFILQRKIPALTCFEMS